MTLAAHGVRVRIVGEAHHQVPDGAMLAASRPDERRKRQEQLARVQIEDGEIGGLIVKTIGEGFGQRDTGEGMALEIGELDRVAAQQGDLSGKETGLLAQGQDESAGDRLAGDRRMGEIEGPRWNLHRQSPVTAL